MLCIDKPEVYVQYQSENYILDQLDIEGLLILD